MNAPVTESTEPMHVSQSTVTPELPSAPSRPPVHLDFLDGLRGIAAMYVVIHHAWLQAWVEITLPSSPHPLVDTLSAWLAYGHFSVTFFITISGFSLMIPVLRSGQLRGGTAGFFKGRAKRILPPYYGALLISLAVAFWFQHIHTPMYYAAFRLTLKAIVLHIFLLHDLLSSTTSQINAPMWSIAVECQIYLLFPLLVFIWHRFGLRATLALTAILSTCLCLLVNGTRAWNLFPHYIFIFSLGMLASIRVHGKKNSLEPSLNCTGYKIAGLLALVVFVLSERIPTLQYVYLQDLSIGVAGCCLLVVVSLEKNNFVRRIASLAPIVWVGGFSYSLYLLHFPLQQLLWQLTAGTYHLSKLSGYLIVLAGTALIVPFSFLFYRVLEKPFMRSKPRA